MQQLVKKDIRFDSADGKTTAAGFFYTSDTVQPFCVLQISHGMCEFMARYEETAAYLAARGVAVCGNDHLGHGETAQLEADFGYFSGKGGREYVLRDIVTMNQLAHSSFPGLPVVMLGHSMGSFFARAYATKYPETISGLIISGTSGTNPMLSAGLGIVSFLSAVKGEKSHSKFMDNLAFGTYMKRIENPKTKFDWITRDTAIVEEYAQNAKCTFSFTIGGFYEMFKTLQSVTGPDWAEKIPKDLPVLILTGAEDPVAGYGEGAKEVHGWLAQAGVKDLEHKLYPGARHEVLNETNREEVFEDVLAFLRRVCNAPAEPEAAGTKTVPTGESPAEGN